MRVKVLSDIVDACGNTLYSSGDIVNADHFKSDVLKVRDPLRSEYHFFTLESNQYEVVDISWHEYHMAMARTASLKSKDPSTKVGCVIVDKNNGIISTGYNGWVKGCNEEFMSWERPLKYNTIIHAEQNAIHFAKRDLSGCVLYVTHGPCDNCLKHILQEGVRDIYYADVGVMKERGRPDQLEAIMRLVRATRVSVKNVSTGIDYLEELCLES